MRFSSDFFKAYNNEIDTQRKRRSENSQAFSEYVKAQQDAGREVSVEELERMRNNLAGGDAYMAGGLPSQVALKGMSERTKEAAEVQRSKERQNLLAEMTKEIETVRSLTKPFVDLDPSDPKDMEKIKARFDASNAGELFEKHNAMIGSSLQTHRLTQLESWKNTHGWNEIESEEEMNALLPQANPWMKQMLRSQFNGKRNRIVAAEDNAAFGAIDFSALAQSAAGNEEAAYSLAYTQFTGSTGREPSLTMQSRMRQAVKGYVAMERTGATNNALAGFADNFSDEQLLAMSQNPADMDALIRAALAEEKLANPSEETMNMARAMLAPMTASARKRIITSSVDKVVNSLAGISTDELKEVDTEEDVDRLVEQQLGSSSFSVGNMTEQEVAEAKARIRSSILSRITYANKSERAEDETNAYNAIIDPKGEIIAMMRSTNSPNRMENVRAAINNKRAAFSLPEIDGESFEGLWSELSIAAKNAASARYDQGIKDAQAEADAIYNANIEAAITQAGRLLDNTDDDVQAVAKALLDKYMVHENQMAVFAAEVNRYVTQEGGDTPAARANAINHLSQSLGLRPKGQAAKREIFESVLAGKDLVKPGTNADLYFGNHMDSYLLNEANMLAARIKAIPLDDTDTASQLMTEFEQLIDDYKEYMVQQLSDDAYDYLLADFNPIAITTRLGQTIDAAKEIVNSSERGGAYSFFNYDRQQGVFKVISDDPAIRQRAMDNGIDPDFTYTRDANGDFVKAERNVGLQGAVDVVAPMNPQASQLSNDLNQMMAGSDLRNALRSAGSSISLGTDGGFAASPAAKGWNYIFGSVEKGKQIQIRAQLGEWLRSKAALDALSASPNPQLEMQRLKENPTAWAAEKGWRPQ